MEISPLKELPQESPYEVKWLVPESKELSPDMVSSLQDQFEKSSIGNVSVTAVANLSENDLQGLKRADKRALYYGDSVIVDAGDGIGALVEAIPQSEQEFSTMDINKALVDADVIPQGKDSLKMGTSGAVVEGDRGAEVIEATALKTREDSKKVVGVLTKAAWSDDEKINVDPLKTPERVLLENEFIVSKGPLKNNKGVFVQIDVENGDVDLYPLIAEAAKEIGLDNFTIRCSISNGVNANLAVIKRLPTEEIKDMAGVKKALVAHNLENDGEFHFVGTRSAEESRQNEKGGEITGNPIYSPNGHYHGYSQDRKIGGHILGITPKKGAKVRFILEPAKVVQVVKKKI